MIYVTPPTDGGVVKMPNSWRHLRLTSAVGHDTQSASQHEEDEIW